MNQECVQKEIQIEGKKKILSDFQICISVPLILATLQESGNFLVITDRLHYLVVGLNKTFAPYFNCFCSC